MPSPAVKMEDFDCLDRVMSDRIAIMDKGRIVQHGTPRDIYRRPNSVFDASRSKSIYVEKRKASTALLARMGHRLEAKAVPRIAGPR